MTNVEQSKKIFSEKLNSAIISEALPKSLRDSRLNLISKDIILPAKIYKYRNCSDENIDAFQQDKVFFSIPSEFNDPFENAFYLNKKLAKRLLDIIYADRNLLNLLKYVTSDVVFEPLIEFNGASKADFLEFVEKHELFPDLPILLSEVVQKNLEDSIKKALKFLQDSFWVSCFAERIDQMLLWSHYANGHKGFALEYDLPRPSGSKKTKNRGTILPVLYTESRYDASKYFEKIKTIDDFKKPYYLKMNDIISAIKVVIEKSNKWKYEKEWRIISYRSFTDNPTKTRKSIGLKPSAIYIGCNAEDNIKDKLMQIAEEKNIPAFQMHMNYASTKYKLGFRKAFNTKIQMQEFL